MENRPPKLQEEELRELAAQLQCPTGDNGLKVGEMMNFTNGNMISKTIASLKLEDGDDVLEIGPGNGMHAKEIVYAAEEVNYMAIDISPVMVAEAQKRNRGLSTVSFQVSDGETIPFRDSRFDKIITTNTIYFWKDPQVYANEMARVLKPGGTFSIGFIPESTMQHLPFAKYGFNFYSEEMVTKLLEASGMEVISANAEKELVETISGSKVEREFIILTAKKI